MATKKELRDRWKREPSISIRQALIDFRLRKKSEPSIGASEIYALLYGLPFREEVADGKDFRGADIGGGADMDLSGADYSYCTSLSNFLRCDLRKTKFDEVTTEGTSFSSFIDGASFKKAKLRSCAFLVSSARNCCFDGAMLKNTYFDNPNLPEDPDLAGSSFLGLKGKGSSFAKTNLTNCDFRGAVLHECNFNGATLDKTSDFRGATLINCWFGGQWDNAGNLLAAPVDWSLSTLDETTKFEDDPTEFPLDQIKHSLRAISDLPSPHSVRLRELLTSSAAEIKRKFQKDWEERLRSQLTPEETSYYEQVLDDAFKLMR